MSHLEKTYEERSVVIGVEPEAVGKYMSCVAEGEIPDWLGAQVLSIGGFTGTEVVDGLTAQYGSRGISYVGSDGHYYHHLGQHPDWIEPRQDQLAATIKPGKYIATTALETRCEPKTSSAIKETSAAFEIGFSPSIDIKGKFVIPGYEGFTADIAQGREYEIGSLKLELSRRAGPNKQPLYTSGIIRLSRDLTNREVIYTPDELVALNQND